MFDDPHFELPSIEQVAMCVARPHSTPGPRRSSMSDVSHATGLVDVFIDVVGPRVAMCLSTMDLCAAGSVVLTLVAG